MNDIYIKMTKLRTEDKANVTTTSIYTYISDDDEIICTTKDKICTEYLRGKKGSYNA
jgi:hypothetical protein